MRLHREVRVRDMEIEVLLKASAFFGREKALQNDHPVVGRWLNGDGDDVAAWQANQVLRSRNHE